MMPEIFKMKTEKGMSNYQLGWRKLSVTEHR